jgi:GTP-binding protein
VNVPVGTVIHRVLGKDETGMLQTVPLADLDTPGIRTLIARGGVCGRGNAAFKCSYRKGPTYSSAGTPGQELELLLELKLIADIGLVGFPNAGKSSLLCALSRASPEIAAYPFTTLKPTVGTVMSDDIEVPTFSIADIPGLIKGAHENKGLGHAFLRHVERTKVLLYVLDLAGSEGRDPVQDFLILREELGLYQSALLERPSLIFGNKQDLRSRSRAYRQNLERIQGVTDFPVICGSAQTGANLQQLVDQLRQTVRAQNLRVQELTSGVGEQQQLRS